MGGIGSLWGQLDHCGGNVSSKLSHEAAMSAVSV